MSAPITTLDAVLGRRPDGIARLVLRHRRHRAFRWLFLVELGLAVLFFVCLIPVLVLAALFGVGDVDIPDFTGRAWRHWQTLELELVDGSGEVIERLVEQPRDTGEGDALVGSILAAARRENLVVLQLVEREHAATWYGGRPLLSDPAVLHTEPARAVVEDAGGRVEWGEEEVRIVLPVPRPGRVQALIGVLLGWPLQLPTEDGRAWLAERWADVRGEPPGEQVFAVRAERLALRRERGGRLLSRQGVHADELLGIAWAASLGFDPEITRRPPHLRWVCIDRVIEVGVPREPRLGRAVRDLLVAATVELRARRPELGLLAEAHPAHCPYCATLYTFGPDTRCPSCGAPASGITAR